MQQLFLMFRAFAEFMACFTALANITMTDE
jgi:hypothetical protein